jgi:2,3-dihydroxybenzoate-AMP ligase
MSVRRAVSGGIVPYPDEVAAHYRERGWWIGRTLGELVDDWVRDWPDRVAMAEGRRAMTYAEMRDRVDALATRMAQDLGLRGGPDGDVVLVQMPNTMELVITILSCLRLGVVPLLTLPAHRQHELSYLAEHATVRAIVVPDTHRDFDHQALAAEIAAHTPSLDHVIVAGDDVAEGHHDLRALIEAPLPEQRPVGAASPSDIAVILLSGGTTGQPKLIARTHDDYHLNVRLCAEALRWNDDTVYLGSIPITHNFALAGPGVLGAFSVGGRVVLLPSPSPAAVFAAVEREGVTDMAAVPAVAQRWIDEGPSTSADLSSLRSLQVGGARMSEASALAVGPALGADVQQVYGMAEGYIAYTRPGDDVEVWSQTQGRAICEDDELRIVDEEDRDLPAGEVGHILVRGPYTIPGYYRAEEHNRRAFTTDGWYRTGDLGRIHPTGNIVVEGRAKDQINRGGEKVACEELEDLLHALPGVSRAAVVGYPDTELGERVGAVIVAAEGPRPTLAQIREALAERGVARFKFPERLLLVDALPLTKVDKIDKVALRLLMTAAEETRPQSEGVAS